MNPKRLCEQQGCLQSCGADDRSKIIAAKKPELHCKTGVRISFFCSCSGFVSSITVTASVKVSRFGVQSGFLHRIPPHMLFSGRPLYSITRIYLQILFVKISEKLLTNHKYVI